MSYLQSNQGVNYTLYYNVLEYFKTIMINHPGIAQVSQGDLYELDDNQFTIYPFGNVNILGANFTPTTTDYTIQVIVGDKLKLKNNESDPRTNAMQVPFYDVDDAVDIHANTLAIINDLLSYTQYSVQSYQINNDIQNEPFTERFNNGLAGWVSTFTLTTHNDRPRCLWDLYPFSSSQSPTCPTAGTLISTYCTGYNRYGIYADGVCGTYNQLIQANSPDCGYVPPGDYNYYQVNGCCYDTRILAVSSSVTNFNPTLGRDTIYIDGMCGFVYSTLSAPQTPNEIWSSSVQVPIDEYGNGDCAFCNRDHYNTISVIPGCIEYSFSYNGFDNSGSITASYIDCSGNPQTQSFQTSGSMGGSITFCSQTKPTLSNRTGYNGYWSYYIDCTGCHI